MDIRRARQVLGLNGISYSMIELDRNYRLLALRHHPDKNSDNLEEATQRFVEINQAHKLLRENLNDQDGNNGGGSGGSGIGIGYDMIFRVFIQSLLRGSVNAATSNMHVNAELEKLITKIIGGGKEMSIKMFEEMDKHTAMKIYDIVHQYHDSLHISLETVAQFTAIMRKKMQHDSVVVLNPSLADMMDDKVYVLEHEDAKYYIPLWHTQLYYHIDQGDASEERELIVNCVPELPDNVQIDDNNNVYIDVTVQLLELFNQEKYTVKMPETKREYILYSRDVRLIRDRPQTIELFSGETPAQGISMINHKSIYDVSKKGKVYAIVSIF